MTDPTLSITHNVTERIFVHNADSSVEFGRSVRRAATRVPPVNFVPHIAREFGWYWQITEQIELVTNTLFQQGRVVDVWNTPQFEAIEWLAGTERLRFPPDFDAGLHGAFCKILAIEAICRDPLILGDIVDALKRVERASAKLCAAADDLAGIRPEVVDFFGRAPVRSAVRISELNSAQTFVSAQLGAMMGLLRAHRSFQLQVHEVFTGESATTGRSSNWVAEFVAIQAADIYRTTHPGPIIQSKQTHRPSFHEFLCRFAESFPDAERADKRSLSRRVWGGDYTGNAFAPI